MVTCIQAYKRCMLYGDWVFQGNSAHFRYCCVQEHILTNQ